MTRSRTITVCICTYRRPEMLTRLLETLTRQDLSRGLQVSVVVADNDAQQSARATVDKFADAYPFPLTYCNEARKNIALVRNCALSHAIGDYVAFIDDDEFPVDDWLIRLCEACERDGVAGVLGPVRPHFETQPPAWLIKGKFCDRPEPTTGTVMDWRKCRTGNVLFRREILQLLPVPFREQFGSGGEDKDFFMRLIEKGCVFHWCNEGVVHETVPPSRRTRSYMLHRAMLRGRNALKQPRGHAVLLAKSALAAPAYALVLPISLLAGQHVFMKYAIRFCDHAGRLLAALHLNPVSERQM